MALQEKDSATINAALNAVSMLGPEARWALPTLIKLANSNTGWEHTHTIEDICKIGVGNSTEGLAVLLKYLEKPDECDGESYTSASVMSALGNVGPANKKAALQALQHVIDTKQRPFDGFANNAIETIKGHNRPGYFGEPDQATPEQP
jgi:HEAT repeat protein